MSGGSWLFVVVVLAVIGYFIAKGWIQEERDVTYQQYCAKRGFHFEAKRPGAEKQYVGLVTNFALGYNHQWRDELSGQLDGNPFSAFEYAYTLNEGKSMWTYKLAMIHWQILGQDLPGFALAPETFSDKLDEALGAQDINFVDDPTFSQSYVLKGNAEAAVRGLFTTSVRQALTANPSQFVAGAGTDLFWWQKGNLPPPDQIEAFLAEGNSFRTIFVDELMGRDVEVPGQPVEERQEPQAATVASDSSQTTGSAHYLRLDTRIYKAIAIGRVLLIVGTLALAALFFLFVVLSFLQVIPCNAFGQRCL